MRIIFSYRNFPFFNVLHRKYVRILFGNDFLNRKQPIFSIYRKAFLNNIIIFKKYQAKKEKAAHHKMDDLLKCYAFTFSLLLFFFEATIPTAAIPSKRNAAIGAGLPVSGNADSLSESL